MKAFVAVREHRVRLRAGALIIVLLLGACTSQRVAKVPAAPVAATPPSERASAPVTRAPAQSVASNASPALALTLPFPADVLYMCVTNDSGQRRQTAIDLSPKVLELCRKHPEMGPCQYERNVCRQGGGRVFASDGSEITPRTEAEYDKRVYRVQYRNN